jgi:5-methylcytosine-specific restriction endonuclease McrA
VQHALVLNATYEPLGVVPQRRALLLCLARKAVPLEDSDTVVHSAGYAAPLPVVVRLTRFVRVPFRSSVPLTRRALFARDGGRCGYCGAPASTVDHVVPRSRGGQHEWTNVVSACGRCNHAKADQTVAELGWRLRVSLHAPAGSAWRVAGTGRHDPHWAPYLAPFGADTDLEAATA